MNPQHCVPTINDNGFILWESQPIMKYLIAKLAPDSPLYPQDIQQRAIVDRALAYYLGNFYPVWLNYFVRLTHSFNVVHYYWINDFQNDIWIGKQFDPEKEKLAKEKLEFFNDMMANTKYVAGSCLTIADFSMIGGLAYADMCDYDISSHGNIVKWMQLVRQDAICGKVYDDFMKAAKEWMSLWKTVNK